MTTREIVKKLCKDRGVSLNKLEKQLGFASGYVSKLDKSVPSSANLQKIADYLGVSLDYLMTGNDDRFSKENIEIDFALLTDKNLREFIEKYQLLSKENRKTLKSNMDFMLSEQNKKK